MRMTLSQLTSAKYGTKVMDDKGNVYTKGQHEDLPWRNGDDRYSSWYLAQSSDIKELKVID